METDRKDPIVSSTTNLTRPKFAAGSFFEILVTVDIGRAVGQIPDNHWAHRTAEDFARQPVPAISSRTFFRGLLSENISGFEYRQDCRKQNESHNDGQHDDQDGFQGRREPCGRARHLGFIAGR